MPLITYDRVTGRISQVQNTPAVRPDDQVMNYSGTFKSGMLQTHYVKDDDVVPRPVFEITTSKEEIAADGEDSARFENIPPGTVAIVNGEEHVVEDGTVELTADNPGEITVGFRLWPYIETNGVIVAK